MEGRGGTGGRLAAESAGEIAEAIDEESAMALPSLQLLTAIDLSDIATYSGTVAGGGD